MRGEKCTDERWEEITMHLTAVQAGDKSVCGSCHADDVARPQEDPEPDRGCGWFRRRP
ncbi:hypothetical protein [Streptomyces sp. NPDC006285]|uniref:hypothetical protein n=1 Tax=Streptomyces sp. NPDC006285 TaxID=3364742 RepID=UPI00368F9A4A